MSRILSFQIKEVEFDFDDEELSVTERQSLIDSVVGNIFKVEVEDDANEQDIGFELIEEVTNRSGWCILSLRYDQVKSTHQKR